MITDEALILREQTPSARHAEPVLPSGQRVDGCLVSTLKCRLKAGRSAILSLTYRLLDGFTAGRATGEYLEAMEVEGHNLSAAFAMRDAEWFSQLPSLTSHTLVSDSEFRTMLTARQDCEFEVEFATAWTISPANEQEEIAPWYAVDLVMKF